MLRPSRNWVVLYQTADGSWLQFTAAYAPTRRAAIRMATAGADNPYPSGVFRAVTAKAWGVPIDVPAND